MHRTALCITLPLAVLATAGSTLAGPLNPPAGPVTSSFKTLSEVEPRTAINAANTPGDADSQFRITTPGSYYLTGNIQGVAGKSGIEIAVNNVTIDLGGFALLGTITSLDGITVSGARNAIIIRNGTISGWGGDGIDLQAAGRGQLIDSVVATGNADWGILAGAAGLVRHCSGSLNGQGGVFSGNGGIVESCTADQNTGIGIAIGQNGVIRDCASSNNSSHGINGNHLCTVTGCTIANNPRGIEVYLSSTVTACSVRDASITGIAATDDCVIRDNCCIDTSVTPFSRGLVIIGANSRIEGNTCVGFGTGFYASGTHNIIVRNTARSNTTNWNIPAGNVCYAVSANANTAINGSNGGTSLGTSDPNANFSY